jgi:hypothetical protein
MCPACQEDGLAQRGADRHCFVGVALRTVDPAHMRVPQMRLWGETLLQGVCIVLPPSALTDCHRS